MLVTFNVKHTRQNLKSVANIDVAGAYDLRESLLTWKRSDIFCEIVSFNSILVDKDPLKSTLDHKSTQNLWQKRSDLRSENF